MGPPGLVAVGAAGVVVTGTGAAIVTGVRTLAPVARVAAVGLLPFTVMHSDDWEGNMQPSLAFGTLGVGGPIS